jgi:hypothetical protein
LALRTIETKAVISAQDQTGTTFAQVAQKLKQMENAAERASGRVAAVNANLGQVAQRRTAMTAASAMVGAASVMVAERGIAKVSQLASAAAQTYRTYDDLRRYQKAILGITDEQQKPLIAQAIHMGASTRFNDLQVLEAQLTLAQRGVKLQFIEPIIKFAADFGQAMGTDLPQAAKTLESAIFSTGQSMETAADAMKNAQRMTDLMVKTAKIGGLDTEGLQELFKFGGASAHAAGLSIEAMGALGAMMSKGGIRGDEAGVAIRSIAGSLVSPKPQALMTLNALGIDFSKYTTMPGGLSASNLDLATRRMLGKSLSQSQKERIQALMEDSAFVASQEEFTKEIVPIIGEAFTPGKGGALKAQDSRTISKVVSGFWKAAIESVDSERLLRDVIAAQPSAAQANMIFTKQQGGRFETVAQRGIREFNEFFDTLRHVNEGFAAGIGKERMGGFAGASSRLEGAIKNFETALGRANDQWMTPLTNTAADLIMKMVDGGDRTMRFATAIGGATIAIGSFEFALAGLAAILNTAGLTGAGAVAARSARALPMAIGALGGSLFSAPALVAGLGASAVGAGATALNAGEDEIARQRKYNQGPFRWLGNAPPEAGRFTPWPAGLKPPVAELKGSAQIMNKLEVTLDPLLLARRIDERIETRGALRTDTGVTMPPD